MGICPSLLASREDQMTLVRLIRPGICSLRQSFGRHCLSLLEPVQLMPVLLTLRPYNRKSRVARVLVLVPPGFPVYLVFLQQTRAVQQHLSKRILHFRMHPIEMRA